MIKCRWCKEYVPSKGRLCIFRGKTTAFYHPACMTAYNRVLKQIEKLAKV